jgi:predicted DNA-binding transcriptional regulator
MFEQIETNELKGNTLRVYWYLLNSSTEFIGPRQIQRALGFSSPSLAAYHLDKLLTLGLVKKNSGEYKLKEIVDVGILKQFMKWKGFIIPRHVTYAILISTLFIFFLTQLREINFYSLFALIFGSLSTAIFWYETLRVWQSRPNKG